MKTLKFIATLIEDTAISADATSTGGHRSLHYIPGSKFLGVCAADYAAFDGWGVFHSGRVRFGNAYPMLGDQRCLPICRKWTESDGDQDPEVKKTFLGAFFAGDTISSPKTVRRQKTAIDRRLRGSALDHSFFDIMALEQGQRFGFEIKIDTDQSDIADRLTQRLTDTEISIGRSKGAEFGLLNCETSDTDWTVPSQGASSGELAFYLVSDLDPGGRTLNEVFDLDPEWTFDPSSSRLSYRKALGFNTHRKLFTTEKSTIGRGSLLVFRGGHQDSALSLELEQRLLMGVGSSRAEGFGEAIVNPDFLTTPPHKVAGSKPPASPAPADRLFSWARKRATSATVDVDALQLALSTLAKMKPLFEAARDESELSNLPLKELRPSKSQWSALRDVAQVTSDVADLKRKLFDDNDGLTRTGQSAKAWRFNTGGAGFRDILEDAFDNEAASRGADEDRFLQRFLLHMAVEATRERQLSEGTQ